MTVWDYNIIQRIFQTSTERNLIHMHSTAIPHTPSLTETTVPSSHTHKRIAAKTLYAFDDCPPARMIRICRLLHDHGFRGDSTLYVMPHSHRFYLSIEETTAKDAESLPPTLLLEEFGTRIVSASMLCCLDEHARCICAHDAVAVMAALMM